MAASPITPLVDTEEVIIAFIVNDYRLGSSPLPHKMKSGIGVYP